MTGVALDLATLKPGRRRGEGGFALATVLGVIALTSLVIAALLGLLLTIILTTESQERSARELRAADGAIEAAIAQARQDPLAADPCSVESPLLPVTSLQFDQGNGGPGDDVQVDVSCRSGVPGDAVSTADQVRLVGADGYRGDIPWTTNCATGVAGPGCFPWTAATGASAPGGLVPNLVHSGRQPLRFDSGVTVRRSAAVLRNPVDGTPAVVTSGQYAQGDPGPRSGGPEECGLLSSGSVGTAAGVVDDLDGSPVCGSSAAAGVDDDLTDTVVGFAVTPGTPAVPDCPTGSVVSISPGRYDAIRTRDLNTLLATCTSRTFWFLPGVFAFDVDSGSAGPTRNALVLGDPGSYYVFGAAAGWDPGAGVAASAAGADPEALLCDAEQSGTSIVLSGRSEIRHLDGRVAICPAFDPSNSDDPFPAVYQETSVPGVTAVPTQPLRRTFTFAWNCGIFSSSCTVTRRHDIALATTGTRELDSVKVLVTGSEPPNTQSNFISNRTTRIEVWPASGPRVCTTGEMTGIPNGGLTAAFELRTGGCAAALTNEAALSDVTLRVFHSLRLGSLLVQQNLTITDVGVQVNSAFGRSTPGEVQDPNGNWTNVGNVAVDDSAVATPVMSCTYAACAVSGPRTPAQVYTHSFDLTDVDVALPPELAPVGDAAGVVALRVLMRLDPSSAALPPELSSLSAENFRPEMTTRLVITTGVGNRCSVTSGFANSPQEVAFDVLDPTDPSGDCDGVIATIGDLQNSSISVQFDLPCIRNWIQNIPGQCMPDNIFAPTGRVWQVRPPNVQSVSLAAASDSYSGPVPTSQVNIDASSNSTFGAAGNVWMPSSDLDIYWRGTAPDVRPLVSGDLVLNGLGSDMQPSANAGVVCCSASRPDSRTVRFIAAVDGEDVLAVTVRFTDVDPSGGYSPGYAVDVLDWSTCGGDGCTDSG